MDLDKDDNILDDNDLLHHQQTVSSRIFDFDETPHDEGNHIGSPSSHSNARNEHGKIKWKRLSRSYNDEYQKLFDAALQPENHDTNFPNSQLGSVTWTSDEKGRLFDAIQRKGRHDLPALSSAVQTKSVFEIRDYLLKVAEAEADRQMFSVHAKHVSHIDIEAAAEIDSDLEGMLDEAANALAAYQDLYDEAEAKSKRPDLWKIDSELATKIAEDNERRDAEVPEEKSNEADDRNDDPKLNFVLSFFHFDTLLELSRTVFMNMPEGNCHDNWNTLTEHDEEPSISMDAVEDLYCIIKLLVQKILQTALFLAESRLRSTSTSDFMPARVLKAVDIEAALDVLSMPVDSFDYWIGTLRRTRMRIVLGGYKERERNEEVTLDQAQEALSVRAARGRHRSLSSMISGGSVNNETDSSPPGSPANRIEGGKNNQINNEEEEEHFAEIDHSGHNVSDNDSDTLGSNYQDEQENVGSSDSGNNLSGDASSSSQEPDTKIYRNRKRYRHIMEEAQDDFMERFDNITAYEEGRHIRKLLGFPVAEEVRNENIGPRPRKLRKTREELKDWTDLLFMSPWEQQKSLKNDLEQHLEL